MGCGCSGSRQVVVDPDQAAQLAAGIADPASMTAAMQNAGSPAPATQELVNA